MTNKDAMIIFTAIMKRMIDNSPYQFALEMGIGDIDDILELHKIVIDALKKADKYKWHDLRKNPDDLPEAIGGGDESDYVLVMIGTPEWNHCEFVYYNHNSRVWSPLYEQNVFAWRYIEPFKEGEEE